MDAAILTAASAELKHQAQTLVDFAQGLYRFTPGEARIASHTATILRPLCSSSPRCTADQFLFNLSTALATLVITPTKPEAARLEPLFAHLAQNARTNTGRTGETVHRSKKARVLA
jgi:hypothetical protein